MDLTVLNERDREARDIWKQAFKTAWEELGTPNEEWALSRLSAAREYYLTVNRLARLYGVDYDPRNKK